MPDELWREAIGLAREYGVCLIARAVGIDYSGLRTRVRKAMEVPGLAKPHFVELPTSLSMVAMEEPATTGGSLVAESGSLIEISRPDFNALQKSPWAALQKSTT